MTTMLLALLLTQIIPPGLPVLNDGAGILNGNFRYWADGEPLHWDITGGREHYVVRGELRKASEITALLTGPGYNYVQISQRIDADRPLGGFTLVLSADAFANEPDTAKLIVRLEDGTKFHSEPHSGNGLWERLIVNAAIPANYAADHVYVVLHHYGSPDFAAIFREVEIHCEPAKAP